MSQTYTAIPFVYSQWFDNNGEPASSHKLFCYVAGTTTKQDTYNGSDSGTASANANPVVLDSAGRAKVFLPPDLSYKFVLAPSNDTDPPVSPIWTVDGVTANQPYGSSVDVSGTAGENIAARDVVYMSDGSGGLTAGRWYKAYTNSAISNSYPTAVGIVNTTATTGSSTTIRTLGKVSGYAGLTDGATYYIGAVAGTPSLTGYRPIGVAISNSIILTPSNAAPFNVDVVAIASGSISAGAWCYLLDSTGQWSNANAGSPGASTRSRHIGYALEAMGVGSPGAMRIYGKVTGLSGLTAGSTYYVSGTPGQITATAPATYVRTVGVADSTTSLILTGDGPQNTLCNYTAVGNVGAGEDDLMSSILAANSLNYIGKVVRVTAFGFTAANANNKTIKVYFGATNVLTTGAVAFNNVGWSMQMNVIRTSGSNQKVSATLWVAGNTPYNGNVFTLSETMTTDITIKMTGEATADNDIVQSGMFIEVLG